MSNQQSAIMKSFIIIASVLIGIFSCQTQKNISKNSNSGLKIEETKSDTTQYELLIFDIKFDSFLASQPPIEFYSQEYYKTWNMQYVTEWNIRHNNPARYGDFYETHIDYIPSVDYGIELNYKLYYYFLFIEKEYGITLVKRGKTSR